MGPVLSLKAEPLRSYGFTKANWPEGGVSSDILDKKSARDACAKGCQTKKSSKRKSSKRKKLSGVDGSHWQRHTPRRHSAPFVICKSYLSRLVLFRNPFPRNCTMPPVAQRDTPANAPEHCPVCVAHCLLHKSPSLFLQSLLLTTGNRKPASRQERGLPRLSQSGGMRHRAQGPRSGHRPNHIESPGCQAQDPDPLRQGRRRQVHIHLPARLCSRPRIRLRNLIVRCRAGWRDGCGHLWTINTKDNGPGG